MTEDRSSQGIWFHTTLLRTISLTHRRIWYRHLHWQLLKDGLSLGSHRSVSVVLDGQRPVVRADRHRLLHELLGDPYVVAIQVGELIPLLQVASVEGAATLLWAASGLPCGGCSTFTQDTLHSIDCGTRRAQRAKAIALKAARVRSAAERPADRWILPAASHSISVPP